MRPVIPTRVAHAGHDSQRFYGRDVHRELLGRTSLAQALLLSVTGQDVDAETAEILTDFSVAATVADPRIWPLRMARHGAAYGNVLGGLSAGMSFMAPGEDGSHGLRSPSVSAWVPSGPKPAMKRWSGRWPTGSTATPSRPAFVGGSRFERTTSGVGPSGRGSRRRDGASCLS